MRVLGNDIFMIFNDDDKDIVNSQPGLPLAGSSGHEVNSYFSLLEKIAALNYHNSRFKLLFRGQKKDYKLNMRGELGTRSSLYPSMLRPSSDGKREDVLDDRFSLLYKAEKLLVERMFVQEISDHQLVRWAILQHYEVCFTPLLDVTSSIQSALSFALADNNNEGFIFVFAFPQTNGPVSVALESLTQVIDLAQVCPPEALRPHFQSAILVGDYPSITNREQSHGKRGMIGNNFACRLLTKFRLTNCTGWPNEGFNPIPEDIMFPNGRDTWYPILEQIKKDISP